ncbi:MAG: response regulator receiver protein [Amycolatopsis sp.]|uniref:response regulator transcription factor n=1 Tax=Amycolatopsis sp. TaxID=37632 RepID=UPI00261934A6|nr:response regulator transcription factor [Amycolatopsis sp.]MCU1685135.1 response regulator receiver protein [Amycolatopsis sp.]
MRVLVVDDDRDIAAAVQRALLAEGFTVELAHDGADGLFKARNNSYDVIVLDIMLPGLNGYAVCREVRAAQVWTPILMLSAKDGEYDEADGLDLGADDYLTKPFSVVVLIARLRALVRRGAPARLVVRHVGDLSLDPAAHRCFRRDAEIRLTPREFAVLEFLMAQPDAVVTKAEILAGVWDENFDGDPNIVEVYVHYLRRKIDDPYGTAMIQTVRGFGYRLSGTGG